METFDINLAGQILTVKPHEDDLFYIYEGEKPIGSIVADVNEVGSFDWSGVEGIKNDFAKQIGELIEEHEM